MGKSQWRNFIGLASEAVLDSEIVHCYGQGLFDLGAHNAQIQFELRKVSQGNSHYEASLVVLFWGAPLPSSLPSMPMAKHEASILSRRDPKLHHHLLLLR